MAEKLCELKKKGGGGAKLVETVLWTNSAPTSNFVSQTVTLSDSINNYDYLAINYKDSISSSSTTKFIVSVSDFKLSINASSTSHNICVLGGQASSKSMGRMVFYTSDTEVNITLAFRLNNAESANNLIIPTAIIGIKNMGGIRTNEKYDILPFKSLPANTAISFTTKGEAKAIWIICKSQTSGTDCLILTNVNPNTNEIDNNTIYRTRTAALGQFDINTGRSFTVTENTISSGFLSSSAYYISCAYTY